MLHFFLKVAVQPDIFPDDPNIVDNHTDGKKQDQSINTPLIIPSGAGRFIASKAEHVRTQGKGIKSNSGKKREIFAAFAG